jgi:hypothetical protein
MKTICELPFLPSDTELKVIFWVTPTSDSKRKRSSGLNPREIFKFEYFRIQFETDADKLSWMNKSTWLKFVSQDFIKQL